MSDQRIINHLEKQFHFNARILRVILKLFSEGATIPFLARYRKEMTGGLDEVQLVNIKNEVELWSNIEKRKVSMIKSLKERGLLNKEISQMLENTNSLVELEDAFLPYKVKRQTKASVARDAGLTPLAKIIFKQENGVIETKKYINPAKGIHCTKDAIQGARIIIAEWISEDVSVRKKLRQLFKHDAKLSSKAIASKKKDGEKFKDYFDYDELIVKVPSHRFLAIQRGSANGFLRVKARPDENEALKILNFKYLKGSSPARKEFELAIVDSYQRLLRPSLENELINEKRLMADREAIQVFSKNLNELLMAAPLGAKAILAIDPGFPSGCKCVCLNAAGDFLEHFNIYPFKSTQDLHEASAKIREVLKTHRISYIAYGNGTASRETESFLKENIDDVHLVTVNENGASIYSASAIARDEFPDKDITVRGAISIGRRLQDPLAELVKIDAKSIGVGQYQHDVDQSELKKSLDSIVEQCVNQVGVELNTASESLLSYVSGLGPSLAKAIVEYRKENGSFLERKSLLKVPRLGKKVYEQAAGFLRIREGKNILDNTAVHPESYALVEQFSKDCQCNIQSLLQNPATRSKINIDDYVNDQFGLPTLMDIMSELNKPNRDPRPNFEIHSFSDKVHELKDLTEGLVLPGIVTNITKFGAFVDIGVHQDGLVHISEIANTYVKDPMDVLALQQSVHVKVLNVDMNRKRIALSIKQV